MQSLPLVASRRLVFSLLTVLILLLQIGAFGGLAASTPTPEAPPLTISFVAGAVSVRFDQRAEPGWSYILEASSDLARWTPLWGSTGVDNRAGAVVVTDLYPPSAVSTRQFRRLLVSSGSLPVAPVFGARPLIVVKLDDLKTTGGGAFSDRWRRVANFAAQRKVKMSFGIIAKSLENPNSTYLAWLRETRDAGLVEFWLHGYDHATHTGADGVTHGEFTGRDYTDYKARLDQSQLLAIRHLGAPFKAFGPPGGGEDGAIDAEARQALHDDPHLRGIMYPSPIDVEGLELQSWGKIKVMDRVWPVNIEQPLFVPDLAKFISGYVKYAPGRRYFVIQGHPPNWTDETRASAFEGIIDYLIAQGAVFVTPSELSALIAAHGM